MVDKIKKSKRRPTKGQKASMKYWLADGGTMSDAIRKTGLYSENMARNPQKVFTPTIYSKMLDDAGLDDATLSRLHRGLANATVLVEKDFNFPETTKTIRVKYKTGKKDEDGEPVYRYDNRTIFTRKPIEDAIIQKTIESQEGCRLISIFYYPHKKIAYYRVPEFTARKHGVDLAYKSKGLMAPEKHDHGIFHEPSAEEKKLISEIFKANKL